MSADGQKILVIRPLEDASTRPLTVVQNSRGVAEEVMLQACLEYNARQASYTGEERSEICYRPSKPDEVLEMGGWL